VGTSAHRRFSNEKSERFPDSNCWAGVKLKRKAGACVTELRMPYIIQKSGDGSSFCVHKQMTDGSTGDVVAGGCHPTEAEAKKHLAALYANVDKSFDEEFKAEKFAWHDSKGMGHLPINNEGEVRAALNAAQNNWTFRGNRMSPAPSSTEKASVVGKICSAAKKFGIESPLCGGGKSLDDSLVYFGGEVKALGDGKIGGWGVLFTSESDPDLTEEFFNSDTDFDLEDRKSVSVLWNHGRDPVLKHRKLARANFRVENAGIWFETILNQRDDYEKAIYKLAEMGKLGWSTGSAPHLVQKEQIGKSFYLKSWPVIELSLTHRPVEARTAAIALKSIEISNLGALIDETEAEAAKESVKSEEKKALAQRLPKLQDFVGGLTFQALSESSKSAEAAVEEFDWHEEILFNGMGHHVSAVEEKSRFRQKDGRRLSAPQLEHIESIGKSLDRSIERRQELRKRITELQKLSEKDEVEREIYNELAKAEIRRTRHITGLVLEGA